MATFLELAQEVRRLSGIAGSGPTDVTTATGIELRIVNFVKNAWIDIQSHPKKWKWMWNEEYFAPAPGGAPIQTIIGVDTYALTDVDEVHTKSFRSYLTATGTSDRQRMTYMPWDDFRRRYNVIQNPQNRRPIHVTRIPNTGAIRLYPPPDDVYSIEFEYFEDVQVLADNTDTPNMPARWHQLIVYEALKRFGKAEDAPEVIAIAEQEGGSEGGPEQGKAATGLWRAMIWDQEYRDDIPTQEQNFMVVRPE